MNKYQEALNRQKSNVKKLRDKEFVEYRDDFATLQELVDKVTPKKPRKIPSFSNYGGNVIKIENWHCPNCNSIIILDSRKPKPPKRCEKCEQLLDWSD